YRGPGTDAGGGGEALTGSILVVPEDAGRQARGPRPGRYGSAPLSARRIALGSGGGGPVRLRPAPCSSGASAGHPAAPAPPAAAPQAGPEDHPSPRTRPRCAARG